MSLLSTPLAAATAWWRGFAVCLSRGLPLTEGIRYAVAVSTANALTKETGYFRREDLDWILPQVSVVPMQAQ